MKNKFYRTSLSLLFTALASGCATTQYITQAEQKLHLEDCTITQKNTLIKKQGKEKSVVAVKDEIIGFDIDCAKHQKSLIDKKTEREIKISKLKTASELLVISFLSKDISPEKKSEYLNRILANLGSEDEDWKKAQEKALTTKGLTQTDIIRAEAIDLIYKVNNGELLIKQKAAAEIIRIYRREKYPKRHNIPRQIVEQELSNHNLKISDIENILSRANPKRISSCKAVENKKKNTVTFVCQ